MRFNDPGLPMMDPVSAVLGLLGLILIVGARRTRQMEGAARALIVTAIFDDAAQRVGDREITPSNLRMVGIFPFVAVRCPRAGAWALLSLLGKVLKGTMRAPEEQVLAGWVLRTLILALFGVGAMRSGILYATWAGRALPRDRRCDGLSGSGGGWRQALVAPADRTIYIASEHYRHPTAALAKTTARRSG